MLFFFLFFFPPGSVKNSVSNHAAAVDVAEVAIEVCLNFFPVTLQESWLSESTGTTRKEDYKYT